MLAKYITRFAEEVIELLVATLFLYEVGKKLKKTFIYYPLHGSAKGGYGGDYAGNNDSYHVHGDHVHGDHVHSGRSDDSNSSSTELTTTMMTLTTLANDAANSLLGNNQSSYDNSSYGHSSYGNSSHGGGVGFA